MTPGFAIVYQISYLTKQGTWSKDARDAHVFATWAIAKSRSRAFRGADIVEAWVA